MRRDMDLIRRICLAVQDLPPGGNLKELDGVAEEVFWEHAKLLLDAGYVEGKALPYLGGGGFAMLSRLTWAGQDFADAARNDTLWARAKEKFIASGASFTVDLLKDWLKAEISKGLGSLG